MLLDIVPLQSCPTLYSSLVPPPRQHSALLPHTPRSTQYFDIPCPDRGQLFSELPTSKLPQGRGLSWCREEVQMPAALAWPQVRPFWRWLLPGQCVQPARHKVLVIHCGQNKADTNVSPLKKAGGRARALFHTTNKTRPPEFTSFRAACAVEGLS